MALLVSVLTHPYTVALLPGTVALVLLVLCAPLLVWTFARIPVAVQAFLESLYDTALEHATNLCYTRTLAQRVVPFVLSVVLYVLLVGIVVTLPGAGVVTLMQDSVPQVPLLAPQSLGIHLLIAVLLVAISVIVSIVARTQGARSVFRNVHRVAAYRAAARVPRVWYQCVREACCEQYLAEPARTLLGGTCVVLAVLSPLVCAWCAPLYPLVAAVSGACVLACALFMLPAWLGYTTEHAHS